MKSIVQNLCKKVKSDFSCSLHSKVTFHFFCTSCVIYYYQSTFCLRTGSREKSSLKKQPSPLSKQVKISLNGILRNLNYKRLHYVRCFKPNQLKEPSIFESNIILNQIQTQRLVSKKSSKASENLRAESVYTFIFQNYRKRSFKKKRVFVLSTS